MGSFVTQNVMHASLCHMTSVGDSRKSRWVEQRTGGQVGGQEGQEGQLGG